jgi:apolipoprotein D and lipocalin family protein
MQYAATTAHICDAITVVQDFNAEAYMGIWYEQHHVRDEYFQFNSWTCNTAQYSALTADGHFTVSNTSESAHQRFNKRFGVTGGAHCPDATKAACFVGFFGNYTDYPNYNVLATDYDNYAIVYVCDPNHKRKTFLWFMSRTPVAEQSLVDDMMAKAKSFLPNFDFTTLAERDVQGDVCTYPKEIVELETADYSLQ